MIGAGLLPSPVLRNEPIGIPSRSDSRPATAAGTAVTSSGTNPSHGSVQSCTATPSAFRSVRNFRTNASSAPVNVKCRISSTWPISGNDRSFASH